MIFLLSYIGYTVVLRLRVPRKKSLEPSLCSFPKSPTEAINGNKDAEPADICQGKDITLINHIAEYIEQSYANPLLNLSQMAQDFGMTENFLYYFFRTRMQKSFAQYLEDKRLEKAQTLIAENTKASLTVLAERCGYANTQTFRRAFKKRYGLTPSEFKRQVFTEKSGL